MTGRADSPPDEGALREGLIQAFSIFVNETPLRHAVGENGRVNATLEMHLEHGFVRWCKGGVVFERRIDVKGAR